MTKPSFGGYSSGTLHSYFFFKIFLKDLIAAFIAEKLARYFLLAVTICIGWRCKARSWHGVCLIVSELALP